MTSSNRRPELRFSWFVPIDGDGEPIGTVNAERPLTNNMMFGVERYISVMTQHLTAPPRT